MRKGLLTMFVLGGVMCASQAWADVSKKTLLFENYETATDASDWSCPNGTVALKTDRGEGYGTTVQAYPSGSGNRTAVKTLSLNPEGYTTDALETEGYNIEFDVKMRSGNVANRSQSELIIPTSAATFTTNSYYSGTDYLFALSQKQRDAASYSTEWYVNDVANEGTAIELDYNNWYHIKLTITNTGVAYTIKQGDTEVTTGSKELTSESVPAAASIWALLGRGNGLLEIDNIDIYSYIDGVSVNEPVIKLTGVNGTSRTYTITFSEGETLNYKRPGDAEYTQISTGVSAEVVVNQSGDLVAYTSIGETKSSEVTENVVAEAISLAAPTIKITNLTENASGTFSPVFTATSDQSAVTLSPTTTTTATFGGKDVSAALVANTFVPSEAGTLEVTVSAEGYDSATSTLEIASPTYIKSWQSVDFSTVTEENAAEKLGEAWVINESTDRWASWNKDGSYKYVTNGDGTSAENTTVNDRLRMRKVVWVNVGFGLGRNSTGTENISYLNMKKGEIAVSTIYNGYGNGTVADRSFDEYSVATGEANPTVGVNPGRILVNAKILSPASNVTISLPYDYQTYASEVALDFTGNTAVEAYAANLNEDGNAVVLTKVEKVAAGEGVILKKIGEATEASVNFGDGTGVNIANQLVGVTAAQTAAELLAANSGSDLYIFTESGFQKIGEGTTGSLAAGKAYLKVTEGAVKVTEGGQGATRLPYVFGGATGISEVSAAQLQGEGAVYSIAGQKVSGALKSGIYVKNGKKFIVK